MTKTDHYGLFVDKFNELLFPVSKESGFEMAYKSNAQIIAKNMWIAVTVAISIMLIGQWEWFRNLVSAAFLNGEFREYELIAKLLVGIFLWLCTTAAAISIFVQWLLMVIPRKLKKPEAWEISASAVVLSYFAILISVIRPEYKNAIETCLGLIIRSGIFLMCIGPAVSAIRNRHIVAGILVLCAWFYSWNKKLFDWALPKIESICEMFRPHISKLLEWHVQFVSLPTDKVIWLTQFVAFFMTAFFLFLDKETVLNGLTPTIRTIFKELVVFISISSYVFPSVDQSTKMLRGWAILKIKESK